MRMCLGLLLSLVSALQICQQSVLSELSDLLSPTQLAVASAAFPLGQFASTLVLALRPCDTRKALVADAWMLIVGAGLAIVPLTAFLCVGRFLMGCGAGVGFVCSTVLLFEMVPYYDRPSNFFVLGIAFAFATLLINALPIVKLGGSLVIVVSSIFTATSGGLYLLLGPRASVSDDSDRLNCVPSVVEHRPSQFPAILVYALMILNVSIGVPVILGFSSVIFEEMGASYDEAVWLSFGFPLAQIVLIAIMYCTKFDRRWLVLGGYGLALFVQFLLLITSKLSYLPPEHSTVAKCVLLWILALISSVPCNTALCIISEQFTETYQQTKYVSKGRAVMWILAAISTSTFVPLLHQIGFTWTFLPYFIITAVTFALVVLIYPSSRSETLEP